MALIAGWGLQNRLTSQIQFYRARDLIRIGKFEQAVIQLQMALIRQPDYIRAWKEMGFTHFQMGSARPLLEKFEYAEKSRKDYESANELNPFDADIAFSLAQIEAWLEFVSPIIENPNKNPYNALPIYQKAFELWPNGFTLHYSYLQYLSQKNNLLIFDVVRNLARIYPGVYRSLRKEPIWTAEIRESFKEGLQQAIDQRLNSAKAYFALSALYQEEEKWNEAILNYRLALNNRSQSRSDKHYLHLGVLYLDLGQIDKAEELFFAALREKSTREKNLKYLFKVYQKREMKDKFDTFYHTLKKRLSLTAVDDLT